MVGSLEVLSKVNLMHWVRMPAAFVILLVALLLQQGYFSHVRAEEQPDAEIFADVSRSAGITHNRLGTVKATGQAWGDYDNDGWLDLYVTDTGGPNVLYHNQGDGTFSVSELAESVTLPNLESTGVTFADYDNDGWQDLYVVSRGPNVLFRNLAGRGFQDVTEMAGVTDPDDGKSASWGDFDQDGNLDLYVVNWSCYPDCGRPTYGDSDHLYHNNGDGTFDDVSVYLGAQTMGAGHAASFLDFDNDGDLDIYLVNDQFINGIGNMLWRNDGSGCKGWCFTEISEQAGVDQRVMGMGIASADYDNDGDLDIYFTNAGPMTLLQNQLDGRFDNIAASAGVETPESVGWGAVFLDYDNDGWRDLYLAVAMKMDFQTLPGNILFHNNADGTFSRIACDTGASDVGGTIGVAYADYDQDGRIDFVIGNHIEGYRLYRNRGIAGVENHWLAVALVGGGPVNRDAVGARVYLKTEDGLAQMDEVTNGSSMGSGNELALHFGLGESEQVAELTIVWPDGLRQTFEQVAADQRYTLHYPVDGDSQLEPVAFVHNGSTPILGLSARSDQWLGVGLMAVLSLGLLYFMAAAILERNRPLSLPGFGVLLLVFAGIILFISACAAFGQKRNLDAQLAALLAEAEIAALESPVMPAAELVALGEMLYWDPELSGNRDTACVTCHHPVFGTGDGLSLPVGTGGHGVGAARVLGVEREFVPRNANSIYNLGFSEWETIFWDGRVEGNKLVGFENPARDRLPDGLDSALAVQAMFPVTSRDEMRGDRGDSDIFGNKNELAWIKDTSPEKIWQALMLRLLALPGYVNLFNAAFPDVPADQLGFEHAANAIAAYETAAFTFTDSPWDEYLRGSQQAISDQAKRGALLFYSEAGCAECHAGDHFSDWDFHNLAVPQIGPGKGMEEPLDFGRARETGDDCDLFAFRTPPLRNIAITGPWMHNGAYATLEGALGHHLDPVTALQNFDPTQLAPEVQELVLTDPDLIAAQLTCPSAPANVIELSNEQIADLLAFLEALTSPAALDLEHIIPESVPSGLTVGGQ